MIFAITLACLATTIPAQAGQIIPWLTGTWDISEGQIDFPVPFSLDQSPFGMVTIAPKVNLTYTTICYPIDPSCGGTYTLLWSGPVLGGTFDWGGFAPPTRMCRLTDG